MPKLALPMTGTADVPDPMLLSDGHVMVFMTNPDEPGGYESQRVGPDDDDYAYWVAQAQAAAKPNAGSSKGLVNLGYITAIIMPLIGFILGIVVVTRPDRRVSKHGARIIALSIVVFIVAVAAITASVNHQVQKARQTLTTELDAIKQHAAEEQASIKQKGEEEQKATQEQFRAIQHKGEEEQAKIAREGQENQRRIEEQGRESQGAIQRAAG